MPDGHRGGLVRRTRLGASILSHGLLEPVLLLQLLLLLLLLLRVLVRLTVLLVIHILLFLRKRPKRLFIGILRRIRPIIIRLGRRGGISKGLRLGRVLIHLILCILHRPARLQPRLLHRSLHLLHLLRVPKPTRLIPPTRLEVFAHDRQMRTHTSAHPLSALEQHLRLARADSGGIDVAFHDGVQRGLRARVATERAVVGHGCNLGEDTAVPAWGGLCVWGEAAVLAVGGDTTREG